MSEDPELFYNYTISDLDNPVSVTMPIERYDLEQAALDAAREWLGAWAVGNHKSQNAARALLIVNLMGLLNLQGEDDA